MRVGKATIVRANSYQELVSRALGYAFYMLYLNIYTSLRQILVILIIPTLNVRKWRLRDVKSLVQIHTARKSYIAG